MAEWYEPIAQQQEVENLMASREQNRLAIRVQQMQMDEMQKQQGVKNFLASNWRQMTAPVQDPAAPTPQPQQAPTDPTAQTPLPGAGLMNTLANPQPAPTAPTGPRQQPGANTLAGGVTAPPVTPQPQPATQPERNATQYPSDSQLMDAINSGKITPEIADGVRAERTQAEQVQKQGYITSKLLYFDKLSKSFIENGDNDGLQQLARAAREDQDIAPHVPKFDSIKIPAKGEIETVRPYTQDQLRAVAVKFPQLGIDPDEPGEPGNYKLVMKNGKPSKFEPVSNKNKPTDFGTFYSGFAAQHPELKGGELDAAASKEWHRLKVAEQTAIGQNRIPALQPIPGAFDPETGAPIIFNRRTGVTKTSKVEGGTDVAAAKQDYEATKTALRDNEKRLTAITTFTNRIDKTIPIVERLAKKYGNNFGGALNKMRSNVKRGAGNTGDLKSLELALFAITGELTKTEMQSIGVAGASATQMQHMASILNESTNAKDILAVLPTIRELSETSKSAIKDVSDQIRAQRSNRGKAGGGETPVNVPPNIQRRVINGLKSGQAFTFTYQGVMYTGKKQGNKLVFE